MHFLDSFFMLALLARKLVSLGYYEISEDEIYKFEIAFVSKTSKLDKVFVRLDRECFIAFCDENKDYIRYDRALNKMIINKKKSLEACKYFEKEYGNAADKIHIDNIDEIIEEAAVYAIGE